MTPRGLKSCFAALLNLPLVKQAICVRLAAEVTAPIWQEWCAKRQEPDYSRDLLGTFDRWLADDASDEYLDLIAKQHCKTLPQNLMDEDEPAGGNAGWALLGIAMIALDQCADVHQDIVQTDICYAAAAHCRIGRNPLSVDPNRLTPGELDFLDQWWRRCCAQFPELPSDRPQNTS